jgi:hypothetical protein
VSRHRSPAAGATGVPHRAVDARGRRAGAPPSSRRRGHGRAVHRGIAAAAVAGGTLAVAAPVASALVNAPEPPLDTAVALAASTAPVTGRSVAAAAVLPVRYDVEPPAGAESLLKSAGLHDAVRRAEEARAAQEARTRCDADLSGLGSVKPWVRDAARFLSCLYDEPDLIGVAGRGRVSDHPRGLAVDLMARGADGDRIAACALANRRALGVEYVIWEQRINFGSGWERMEDRGSATENHVDHVHVSFRAGSGSGTPDPDLCR